MLTSIDREGMGKGFDIELTRAVATRVPIPVIACGGAGTVGHCAAVIIDGRADAVSVSSLLHYDFVRRRDAAAALDSRPPATRSPGLMKSVARQISPASLPELKSHLASCGIDTRQPEVTSAAH